LPEKQKRVPAVPHSYVRSERGELKREPATVTLADSATGREQVPVWPQGQEGIADSGGTALHIRPKLMELADPAGIAMEPPAPLVVRELKDANTGINKG